MKTETFYPDLLVIPFKLVRDKNLEQVDRMLYGVIYWYQHLKDGRCFASNEKIANILGTTVRVVQNSLTSLEKAGYIKRIYKDVAKRNRLEIRALLAFGVGRVSSMGDSKKSNDLEVIRELPIGDRASDPQVTRVRIGNKNSIDNTSATSAQSFILREEIQRLEDNTRRDMQIIGLYFLQRKPDIRTREQLHQAIKRHLRAAKGLVPFEDDQILKGFRKAAQQTDGWTIETASKMLTK